MRHETILPFNMLLWYILIFCWQCPASWSSLAPSLALELSTAQLRGSGSGWLTVYCVWHKWGWWLLFSRPWYQLLNSSKQRKEFLSASIKLTSKTRWVHYTPVGSVGSVASSVGSPATAAANVHYSLHSAALVVAWLKSISHLLQLPDGCVGD